MDSPSPSNAPKRTHAVVVGGGLAGICAAIAASEKGASVTVLDRAYGGGSSAISGGVVYAGGGTAYQKDAGYGDDTPDNMFRYLRLEAGDAVDEATLRRFCDDSVSLLKWLERHGAVFQGSLCPFKTSYPTSEYHLYFSGNEKAHPFATVADPAPRGHRAVPQGSGSGAMGMTGGCLWRALFDSAMSLGVKFEPASRVEHLAQDADGRVTGVRYRTIDDKSWTVKTYRWLTQTALELQSTIQPLAAWLDLLADIIWDWAAVDKALESDAVILAAGGFVMNKKMVEKFTPWGTLCAGLGNAGDDGSGIQLGQSAGGAVSHMDRISIWRLMYPPEALLEGVVVSASGERIAAEDMYGASFSNVLAKEFDGRGFLILDSVQWDKVRGQIQSQTQMLWRTFIRYLVLWAHRKADSLEDLAAKLRIDSAALRETVAAYNEATVSHGPDPVGKISYRTTIEKGPFYGIDISLRRSGILMSPALTLGGLRVDGASGLVLNGKAETIPGLYAVGRNAVGICSNNYVSGLSLADCAFSGKRSGEHAATAPAHPEKLTTERTEAERTHTVSQQWSGMERRRSTWVEAR